jgi:PadR family transcriptional regulator, regulatory protein PadR
MKQGSPGGQLEGMVLAILADGPLHGYAVISELRRRSDEAFDLPEGTVYPVLHKLQQQGHISGTWSDVGGRSRCTYRITRRGIRALEEQRRSWVSFRVAVSKVLGEEPWPART